MVDDILALVPGESVTGYKKVGAKEVWVKGHFPGAPVFPGVLLIEHMTQVSLFLSYGKARETLPYLARVDQVKFLNPVYPGEELYTEVRKLSSGAGFVKTEAIIYIGSNKEKKAAVGKLTCYLGEDL